MKVYLVAPEHIAGLWPQVAPFIKGAMARAEVQLWDEWDIKKALLTGQWFLWIAIDDGLVPHAAIVTRIADYPRGRLYEVPYIGGRRMKDWLAPVKDAIEGHARQLGAMAMIGFGRAGWCRVAGYRELYTVFAKDLGT